MEEKIINGKVLYTPKGAAREYAAVGCNFYTGCPHNCSYCYLKRGAPSKQLGGIEVKLKKCLKDEVTARLILAKELDANLEYLQKVGIFLSFTTDPLIPETRDLTIAAVTYATIVRGIPVTMLTKNADFIKDPHCMSIFEDIPERDRKKIAFGFTLTGHDDMEPGASPNHDRIEAMKTMHQKGFKTWASIEPIVDFYSSLAMIELCGEICNHFKIGLMSGVKKDYYDDNELVSFLRKLVEFKKNYPIATIYLKDSIRKRIADSYLIDTISIGKIYNIFDD